GGVIGKAIFGGGVGGFFNLRTWGLGLLGSLILLGAYRFIAGRRAKTCPPKPANPGRPHGASGGVLVSSPARRTTRVVAGTLRARAVLHSNADALPQALPCAGSPWEGAGGGEKGVVLVPAGDGDPGTVVSKRAHQDLRLLAVPGEVQGPRAQ